MIDKKQDECKVSGLTKEEVDVRVREGKINTPPKNPSRSFGEIVRANLFTIYNAINLVLAIIVIIAGSPKNALFAGVILSNTVIGIVQEVRAKKTLEKMSLVNVAKAKVLRDGKEEIILAEHLVLDDIILLTPGIQLLVDGELIQGNNVEMNESMLTGESDRVIKKDGDDLFSGSFVEKGSGYARVTKVGSNTYAASLSIEAKRFKRINSEILYSVNKILKMIIWFILPIGILLLTMQIMFNQKSWQDAAISSVAGIIGMVPEGLILLTSLTLVMAVVRLSKWNTLVQELPATEVLARVDILCLDKTGTITEGRLKMNNLIPLINSKDINYIEDMLNGFIHSFPNENQTSDAILNRYNNKNNIEVLSKIPFTSDKKWSSVTFLDEGIWILGAPESILGDNYDLVKSKVEEAATKGNRVLLFARYNSDNIEEILDNDKVEAAALILIDDVIRKEAPETLEYFHKQGVEVKIISGDNPITVSEVAKKAGVRNAERYIDARELGNDEKKLSDILDSNTVFGRVTPHQKKKFVKALQSKGHTVAMTGDGINDVLALKESDCGIAMANGSDATKAVAQLVLLDSNFSALPKVVLEGRRTINNLERVANLYLSKTVYSLLLAILFCVLFLPYPIMPIQLGLIGSVSIGIPSFFLALAPNNSIVKKGFLKRAISLAIPSGIYISLITVLIFILAKNKGLNLEQCRTLSTIVIGGCSLMLLLEISKPLNKFKVILNSLMSILFIAPFFISIGRRFYMLEKSPILYISIAIVLILIYPFSIKILSKLLGDIKLPFLKVEE
ncbi:cation-translocating P-type ATPase [Hathewaya histolytica]|uniref:Cation-transporting ATPase, P-type n=1 Tax=Hathewaya histolytica TaxID=1498 RepID=A0A4V6KDH1_HATHI|nr:cation-translocating P-type ATPase [Hathewaya histolytica]VTQ90507.1 cation-transporting ATPase, P-type [Hathewaya histolytica]